MEDLNKLCEEILKDENGNVINPVCGLEKLLCCMIERIESGGGSSSDDIDGGYPGNATE